MEGKLEDLKEDLWSKHANSWEWGWGTTMSYEEFSKAIDELLTKLN